MLIKVIQKASGFIPPGWSVGQGPSKRKRHYIQVLNAMLMQLSRCTHAAAGSPFSTCARLDTNMHLEVGNWSEQMESCKCHCQALAASLVAVGGLLCWASWCSLWTRKGGKAHIPQSSSSGSPPRMNTLVLWGNIQWPLLIKRSHTEYPWTAEFNRETHQAPGKAAPGLPVDQNGPRACSLYQSKATTFSRV